MPIYEYRCPRCEKVIEEFKPISKRDELPECEECKVPMEKVISASDFKFKGAPPRGWKPLKKSTADIPKASDMIRENRRKQGLL